MFGFKLQRDEGRQRAHSTWESRHKFQSGNLINVVVVLRLEHWIGFRDPDTHLRQSRPFFVLAVSKFHHQRCTALLRQHGFHDVGSFVIAVVKLKFLWLFPFCQPYFTRGEFGWLRFSQGWAKKLQIKSPATERGEGSSLKLGCGQTLKE